MTKHPLIFLAVSGLITASIGAVATHYIGRALQKREARGRLEGELAEAEALGEEPVRANPEEAELGFDDWMTNMEQRLINLSAHMGVKE